MAKPREAQVQIRLPEEQLQQYIRFTQEDSRLTENLAKVTAQLEAELASRRAKFVTRKEVFNLGTDVLVYKTVGKAFIRDSVKATADQLRAELGRSDDRILKIKKTGIYIVGERDAVRQQIDELVKPFLPKK
jgi:chaperonin cofactor prefoldin